MNRAIGKPTGVKIGSVPPATVWMSPDLHPTAAFTSDDVGNVFQLTWFGKWALTRRIRWSWRFYKWSMWAEDYGDWIEAGLWAVVFVVGVVIAGVAIWCNP